MTKASLYHSLFSVQPENFITEYLSTSFTDENAKKAFLREAIPAAMSHNRHLTAVLCSLLLGEKSHYIPEKFYSLASPALQKLNQAHSQLNLNFDLIPIKEIPSDFIDLFFSLDNKIQQQFILSVAGADTKPKNFQKLCKVLSNTCSNDAGNHESNVMILLKQMFESSDNELFVSLIISMLNQDANQIQNNQRDLLIIGALANPSIVSKMDQLEFEQTMELVLKQDEFDQEAHPVAVFCHGPLIEKIVARQNQKVKTEMLLNLMTVGYYPTNFLAKMILEQSNFNVMKFIESREFRIKKSKIQQLQSMECVFYLVMNFALKELNGALDSLNLPLVIKKKVQSKSNKLGIHHSVFFNEKLENGDSFSELPTELTQMIMDYLSVEELGKFRLASRWFNKVYLGKVNDSHIAKQGDYRKISQDLAALPSSFCQRFSILAFTPSGSLLGKVAFYCLVAATLEIMFYYALTTVCLNFAEYDVNNARLLSAVGDDRFYRVTFLAQLLPSTAICPLPRSVEAHTSVYYRFSSSSLLNAALEEANGQYNQLKMIAFFLNLFSMLWVMPLLGIGLLYSEVTKPIWKSLAGGKFKNSYPKSEALILQDQLTLFLAVINAHRKQLQDPNYLLSLHYGLTKLQAELTRFTRDGETKLDLQSTIDDLQITKTNYDALQQTLTQLFASIDGWRWEALLSSEENWACFTRLNPPIKESVVVIPDNHSDERKPLLSAHSNDDDDNEQYYRDLGDVPLMRI